MAYDQRIIEQVQSLNDIVEVLSNYIVLKRAGRGFKAVCPFHGEKTPSFHVNPERQIFHCFGCGEGGDVFAFLMKHEQMSFPEALKMLAERVHVTLPETSFQKQEKSQSDVLYQIYEQAQNFYRAQFLETQAAAKARDYWKARGFGSEEAKTYGIGYAPDDWRQLFEFLSKKGFKQDLLLKSGLFGRSGQGNPYDLFRSRLMFPIHNLQNKVMAFGGRILESGAKTDSKSTEKQGPKYLNSPETDIFKKRREFYGLPAARKSLLSQGDIRRFLIVEGYMDCIQLQVHGFQNTVATLGTALTPEHVRILKRYIDEAIMVYDGDKAGEEAALRGLDVFLEEGLSVRALSLPKGMDPDDFIRSKGEAALREMVENAQDFFDFKLRALLSKYNKTDSIGLLKITNEFFDTFLKIQSSVLLDRYLKRLASSLGVDERSIRQEFSKLQSKGKMMRQGEPAQPAQPAQPKVTTSELAYEKVMLAILLQYPQLLESFRYELPDYEFQGRQSRELFQLLGHQISKNPEQFSSVKFLGQVTDAVLRRFVSELAVSEWSESEAERAFRDCLQKMKHVTKETQLKELRNKISRAEEIRDHKAVDQLMQEYKQLLGSSGSKASFD